MIVYVIALAFVLSVQHIIAGSHPSRADRDTALASDASSPEVSPPTSGRRSFGQTIRHVSISESSL
jgi:hypothetical protein